MLAQTVLDLLLFINWICSFPTTLLQKMIFWSKYHSFVSNVIVFLGWLLGKHQLIWMILFTINKWIVWSWGLKDSARRAISGVIITLMGNFAQFGLWFWFRSWLSCIFLRLSSYPFLAFWFWKSFFRFVFDLFGFALKILVLEYVLILILEWYVVTIAYLVFLGLLMLMNLLESSFMLAFIWELWTFRHFYLKLSIKLLIMIHITLIDLRIRLNSVMMSLLIIILVLLIKHLFKLELHHQFFINNIDKAVFLRMIVLGLSFNVITDGT